MKKILIAKVSAAFGIKGEMKIIAFCEDPLKLEKYTLFDAAGNQLKLKISNKNKAVIGTSNGNPILIVKIDGINDRNTSEQMRNAEIFANRADFAKTKANEFYYVDLIGLDAINENSQKIGKVINVFDHGAGGVIEIEFDENFLPKNYEKISNFPFKNEIFPEVNIEKNFITICVPEVVEMR